MRASDLLRDLIEPGTPAKAANPANSSASTAFAGLRMAANACESAGDGCEISQDSQAFAKAESEQPCGFSQDSQLSQPTGDAPCPTCGCGSFWRGESGVWRCESCHPPGAEHVSTWRNFSGAKVPAMPPTTEPWPAHMNALLNRVAAAFEWSPADRKDFAAWARRSAEGLANARQFLERENARIPVPGLIAGLAEKQEGTT